MRAINKIEEITRLFYEEHLKGTEIAKRIGVNKSYVTKIIQKDERYINDKESRMIQSKERHNACKREYIIRKRQTDKQEYQALLRQINADNEYLSTKNEMSDVAFTNWNRGMFDYDKYSSDLILKKGITTGYNVPKRVSNRVMPNCIKANV